MAPTKWRRDPKTPTMHRETKKAPGVVGAFKESFNRLRIKVP